MFGTIFKSLIKERLDNLETSVLRLTEIVNNINNKINFKKDLYQENKIITNSCDGKCNTCEIFDDCQESMYF